MEKAKNDRRDRHAEIILRNILRDKRSYPEPDDNKLWAYALNLLDPDEEDYVMNAIAHSETAQEELERIRKAVLDAKASSSVSLRELVKTRFAPVWANLRKSFVSTSAAVVRVPGGLVTAFLGSEFKEVPLKPVLLDHGEKRAEEGSVEEEPKQRVEYKGPKGIRVSMIDLKDKGVDIQIEIPDKSVKDCLKLSTLTPGEAGPSEEHTDMQEYLQEGQAVFPRCRDGLLRISGPGGLLIDIYLGPMNPPLDPTGTL